MSENTGMNEAIRRAAGKAPRRDAQDQDTPLEELDNAELSDRLDAGLASISDVVAEMQARLAAVEEGGVEH